MKFKTLQKTLLISYFITFILSACFIFSACDTTDPENNFGVLTVELTDAPIDSATAVNVAIERVEVNSREDDNGWVVVAEVNQTFNLLDLANGAAAVLGSKELEAGTYNQIRLVLAADGHSVVAQGEEYDLVIPGGVQTGVKLNIHAKVEPESEQVILLDFDAARSVVTGAGSRSTYLLRPVIRATLRADTGNISGTVSPAEARPVIYALAGGDTLASTLADPSDGDFKLIGLEEGSVAVSIEPRNDIYPDTTLENIQVSVDETARLGTVKLNQN